MSARVEFYTDLAGEWRWRVRAANNEILATSSEGYMRKADAEHGYELVRASNEGDEMETPGPVSEPEAPPPEQPEPTPEPTPEEDE